MTTTTVLTDEGEELEVYEGPPDILDRNLAGKQDDLLGFAGAAFLALGVRTTKIALQWYADHRAFPGTLDFDPDGMCLKVVRTARGIGPKYASAFEAQVATPNRYRVFKIADMHIGMPIYFDDPHDNNDFGHVATIVGRVAGTDRDSLSSLLLKTNSVKSNQLVTVRGDYFKKNWGDPLRFAATWLNGVVIPDLQEETPVPPKPTKSRGSNIDAAVRALEEEVAGKNFKRNSVRGLLVRGALWRLRKISYIN